MPFELRSLFCCIPYLRLDVQGAVPAAGIWVADYSAAGGNVTVSAYTTLGTPIAWAIANGVGAATPAGDQYNVPLNNAANINPVGTAIRVTATANGIVQFVDIEVKPFLQQLRVIGDHYAFQDPGGQWHAYDLAPLMAGALPLGAAAPPVLTANVRATVQPATAHALGHLQWAGATIPGALPVPLTPVNNDTQGIPLNAVRNVRVTVSVPGSPTQAPHHVSVDVHAPGNGVNLASNLGIQLDQFTFDGAGRFAVTQEDAANFNNAYGAIWQRAPALAPPQGYAAAGAMALNAVTVSVTAAPTANSNLQVRANAYFPLANGIAITVLQGAVPAAPGLLVANGTAIGTVIALGAIALGNVPPEVMVNDPLLIFWEANNGAGWRLLTVTANTVYVTARAPAAATLGYLNNPVSGTVFTYPTLLDMSCRVARGQPAVPPAPAPVPLPLKNAIYAAFQPANPNLRARRLNPPAWAPTQLTYWLNHALAPPIAQVLNQAPPLGGGPALNMFTVAAGNVACGVWAQMLIALWALHGEGGGRYIQVRPSLPNLPLLLGMPPYPLGFPNLPNLVNASDFAVRDWNYNNPAALMPGNYTHTVTPPPTANPNQVVEAPVAGQNNAAPMSRFSLHYIVRDGAGGNFYDPSYGTAPMPNKAAWMDASLGGLWNAMTNQAGFVQPNPAPPPANPTLTTHNAVILRDYVANQWVLPP